MDRKEHLVEHDWDAGNNKGSVDKRRVMDRIDLKEARREIKKAMKDYRPSFRVEKTNGKKGK